VFRNCEAHYHGGAIHVIGLSAPAIEACIFEDNRSAITLLGGIGGAIGINNESASATITVVDCTFRGNRSSRGGAVGVYHSELQMPPEDVSISRCVFQDNSATIMDGDDDLGQGGAVFLGHSLGRMEFSTLYGNRGDQGGGIYLGPNGIMTQIWNSIVASSRAGGAVRCDPWGTISDMVCCDLFGNAGGDWGQEGDCTYWFAGQAGNISADPLFCAPEQGDFRLWDASPCLPGATPECPEGMGAWTETCGVSSAGEEATAPPRRHLAAGAPLGAGRGVEIHYLVPAAQGTWEVRLEIYDPAGRLVRRLVEGPRASGAQRIVWPGDGADGQPVAGGVYLCRLRVGEVVETVRLLLVRW